MDKLSRLVGNEAPIWHEIKEGQREACEKAARRVQETCAGIARKRENSSFTGDWPYDSGYGTAAMGIADDIEDLDIKKLLAEEGE